MANPDNEHLSAPRNVHGDVTPDANEIPLAAELNPSDTDALINEIARSTLDESRLLHLLERKDLSGSVLEEIGRHRDWLRSYRVRRALAFHVHVPRTLAIRLLRELHLVDLVKLSLAPVAVADLRRIAEDQILSRLGQVSLGEKIALAKRSSGRVLSALIAEGNPRLFEPALRNARLTESQILKLLANECLPERAVIAITSHPRWEALPNVRLALLRHPQMPYELAGGALGHLTMSDLNALIGVKTISAKLRKAIEKEIGGRKTPGKERP
jgi:hypothetical protein